MKGRMGVAKVVVSSCAAVLLTWELREVGGVKLRRTLET
jgi:hypothetical protein